MKVYENVKARIDLLYSWVTLRLEIQFALQSGLKQGLLVCEEAFTK